MRTYNINIEALDNGFLINCYAYPQSGDEFAAGPAKQLRKYLTSMEDVADEIKTFIGVEV